MGGSGAANQRAPEGTTPGTRSALRFDRGTSSSMAGVDDRNTNATDEGHASHGPLGQCDARLRQQVRSELDGSVA